MLLTLPMVLESSPTKKLKLQVTTVGGLSASGRRMRFRQTNSPCSVIEADDGGHDVGKFGRDMNVAVIAVMDMCGV